MVLTHSIYELIFFNFEHHNDHAWTLNIQYPLYVRVTHTLNYIRPWRLKFIVRSIRLTLYTGKLVKVFPQNDILIV